MNLRLSPHQIGATLCILMWRISHGLKMILHHMLCRCMGQATGQMCWGGTLLMNKLCPGVIHVQHSFDTWHERRMGDICSRTVVAAGVRT